MRHKCDRSGVINGKIQLRAFIIQASASTFLDKKLHFNKQSQNLENCEDMVKCYQIIIFNTHFLVH